MTDETQVVEQTATVTEAPSQPTVIETEDDALRSAYRKAMSDGVEDAPTAEEKAQAVRDEKGRFAKSASEAATAQKEPEGQPDEGQEVSSDHTAPTASLPANWRPDMADIWTKLPEPERDRLGKWSQELHGKMSEQGRQIATLREFQPIVEHIQNAFPDRFGPNGMPPVQGLAALVDAAYVLDRQPVQALLQLAEEHGAIDHLRQALGVQGGEAGQIITGLQNEIRELRRELSGAAAPDRIQQQIEHAMTVREISASVERFKAEKPFYAEVESKLPTFIEIAWSEKPDASPAEIHQLAYDMAVYANPATREKALAAATKAAAPKPDPKAAAAKKAASINVTSTANGAAPVSEDDEMRAAYRRAIAS